MSTWVEQRLLPVAGPEPGINHQFRVCAVQVYNWGRYQGVQRVTIGRKGTAILGPSGGGKSTLLDAMASVIMPNPQEFNQAARDDLGRKSERTVYTYARGLLDQRPDGSGRGATARYLRPAGTKSFVSGTAITWETAAHQKVTAIRLIWVAQDTTDAAALNNATMYGFVNDDFDMTSLNGLKGVRLGASPLTRTTLESLVDSARGDVFDSSQARIHAKMREVMGLGETEESQKFALQLLRRAQASKGVFSINALFKEFVLVEPLALSRWETTLADYRESVKLFGEYETARKRLDILKDLPDHALLYGKAVTGHAGKQTILDAQPGHASRLRVWHSGKVHTWCERRIDDLVLDQADLNESLQDANSALLRVKALETDLEGRITSEGGDRTLLVRTQIGHHAQIKQGIERVRNGFSTRLAKFGKRLPTSAGDLDLLLHELAELKKTAEAEERKHGGAYDKAIAQANLANQDLREAEKELERLRKTSGNVPSDAAKRRHNIAVGTRILESRLPYAGELMQVSAAHKQWERALSNLLGPLARRILVDAGDYEQVRQWVYDNQMDGEVHLQRVWTSRTHAAAGVTGSVADMVELQPGSPYREWLASEMSEIARLAPARHLGDLDRPAPKGMRGWITVNGMRSVNADQVIKNDRRLTYTWLGWDNTALREQYETRIDSLLGEKNAAVDRATALHRDQNEAHDRAIALDGVRKELTWEQIDLGPVDDQIERLQAELEETETPQMKELREAREGAREQVRLATNKAEGIETEIKAIADEIESLYELKARAWDVLHDEDPLCNEELTLLDDVTFAEPSNSDDVAKSFTAAVDELERQIADHDKERTSLAAAITAIIGRYCDHDEQFDRESDGTIASLPAVLAIHSQLKSDNLPRTRRRWMEKASQGLNEQLRILITQIDADGRDIRKGLAPINSVLERVPFRNGTLNIEAVPHPTKEYRDLHAVVEKYTSNTLGVEPDPNDVEERFKQLRAGLAKLDESASVGEAWRRRAFDAREHFEFRAIETRADGTQAIYEGVSGMSGGEGQELIAFILGAALRYRLGEGHDRVPTYGTIILDEGFVKSDNDYTGRALEALTALGFHLIIGAPREKANAFEDYVDTVAYSSTTSGDPNRIQLYSMSIEEAINTGVGGSEEP